MICVNEFESYHSDIDYAHIRRRMYPIEMEVIIMKKCTLENRIVGTLYKCPLSVIIIVTIVTMALIGVTATRQDLVITKIIGEGFSYDRWLSLLKWSIAAVIADRSCVLPQKLMTTKITNTLYPTTLYKAYHSKLSDINKLSTGKLTDALASMSHFQSDIVLEAIRTLPALIPFATLLWKELTSVCWWTSVTTLLAMVLTVVVFFVGENVLHLSEMASKKKGELNGTTVDLFLNLKTIKYLNAFTYARDRMERKQDEYVPYASSIRRILLNGLPMIFSYGALVLNSYMVRNDIESLSLIMMFNHYVFQMACHLSNLADNVVEYRSAKKIVGNLDGSDNKEKRSIDKRIVLDDVDFDYGKDSTHFHIDYLTFEVGKRYNVTGESGEGKSSLANLIAGAILPTKYGTGTSMESVKTYYVWQETEMFNDTLWNNISVGEDIEENEVTALMKRLNLHELLEKGYDTLIGEKGCKLSSGQKQRVNIIRAILRMRRHPDEVFILDEITSNLDEETQNIAIDLIDKECESTLIVISHHGNFDAICDHHINVVNHQFKMD